MHRRLLIRSAAAATLLPAAARAQPFPSKQLRILVATPPGGGLDLVARILAQELTKSAGLSILVENKVGGAGTIAVREALRAPPDGYTILLGTIGMLAVNPYAMKDAGYNPPTDITPICMAVDFSNVLAVHPDVPARTLADYLELGRRPDGIDYGTAGIGSAGHLAGELLRVRSGARLNHVPFRGGGPAMNDLMGGHIASAMASGPTATSAIREGRIRALALTAAQRTPIDPDVPTIAELGFPGYAATNWYTLVVSSKVPRDIVDRLNTLMNGALGASEVREAYARQGMMTLGGTVDDAAAYIARETTVWKKVIADAGIRME
ncbi:Bug family tripartite tricarboxylate transporter substrate binding protein [Reyranella sp.]|uniref:Bug family tripartite tricarboxylate transporter substrate binding protein n=1 Tax=Reyranella sp. TaxID=1929291 RepID=UPI003D12DC04